MNSKSVKGRGKRFLAGFLALLMAVTLLPANVAGVAYAEELDAIETEAPDSVVAVDEETEAADSVVTADEETDEPQVNDAESSEDVETEDVLTADEEDLALEEAVPELEAAVAVASEEVLEPAEVSAAVTADTSKYDEKVNDGKVRSWTFDKASAMKWVNKDDGNTTLTADHDLDGIKLSGGTVTLKPTDTSGSGDNVVEAPNLTLARGGKIDIPVDDDTDAIAIEITITGRNAKRYILIGAGTKQEKVYQKQDSSDILTYFGNDKVYTNEKLYLKTDNMFSTVQNDDETSSTVLTIEAGDEEDSSKDFKIASIVLHEYKEKVDSVDLTNATVDLSVGTDKAKTAVYTGEPVDLNVVVTIPGEGDATTTVNPKAYTTSFLRETDTVGTYEDTDDLTSVGNIKVKVTSIDETNPTEAESVDVFTITQATLETSDKEVSIDAGQIADYASAKLDLAALIKPLSEEDIFTYSVDNTHDDYEAGAVVTGTPEIAADGKMTYAVDLNATTDSTATVLVVKVESKNYADAYIKVTVAIANKTAVTVSGNSVTHTYNGAAYGFKANAVITVTGASGETLDDAIADIKKNLTYKFTKVVSGTPDANTETTDEPTAVGVYKVTATLSDDSDYTMTKYIGGVDADDNDVDVTLTIEPKTVTIKPNDITWDKTINPTTPPANKATATKDDYECTGLVAPDTAATIIKTQPSINYYEHGDTHDNTTLMTPEKWNALANGALVDIVAAGATVESDGNYALDYEVATCTVVERTLATITNSIPTTGSTLRASDVIDVTQSPLPALTTTKEATGSAAGFYIIADQDHSITAESKSGIVDGCSHRIKIGNSGYPYYNSIAFKTDKAATLKIKATAGNSSNKSHMVLAKLNEAETEVAECVGAPIKVTNKATTTVQYEGTYDTDKRIEIINSNGNNWDTVEVKLTNAGTYYIYGTGEEPDTRIYEVSVTYDATTPSVDTVAITPTISPEDLAKLDGATLYFTATDETDVPVTASGTAVQLKKGVTYSLVAKKNNVVDQTITAKIDGNANYTVPNAAASITITVEVESLTANITPTISADEAAKLDGAKVYFTAIGEEDAEVVSGEALQLKKGTTYTLVVKKNNTTDETMAAKINDSTEYEVTDDATVAITIVTGLTPAERVAITPNISDDDLDKLDGAKVYFTAPGEKLEVTSGTAVNLKKAVKYTLVVEKNGTTVANTTAQIGTSAEYTPTAETTVTITISVTQAPTKPAAPTASPNGGRILPGATITLSAADADEILYTRGADENIAAPTAQNGTVYIAADKITAPTTEGKFVIKAIAVKNGVASDVQTVIYTVRESSGKTGFSVELVDDGTYTYTGSAIIPDIEVYNNDELLTEGVDYTVKCANNVNASVKKPATLTVTGKGRFSGSQKVEFNIAQKSLGDAEHDIIGTGIETGNIVIAKGSKAAPVIIYNGVKLANKDIVIPNTKYNTVTAEDTPEEEKTVIITAKENGNFTGSLKLDVKVVEKNELKNYQLKVALTKGVTYTYNGSQQEVSLDVKDVNGNLLPETDHLASEYYYVSYNTTDRTNAGVVKFTVYGTGDYAGSVSKSFTIKPADKNKTTVNITGDPWSGSYEVPYAVAGATLDSYFDDDIKVEATVEGVTESLTLKKDRDYKVTYSGNKKSGTAKATVSFIGNYKGIAKQQQTFTIKGREVNATVGSADLEAINLDVKFGATKPYKNEGIYKAPVILSMDGVTVKNSEFDIKYYTEAADDDGNFDSSKEMKGKNKLVISSENETPADSATVYVELTGKAKGNFAGSKITGQYQVYKEADYDLSKAKVTFYTYDAKKGYVKSSKLPYTGEAIVFGSAADDTNHTPYLEVSIGKDTVPTDAYKVEYVNNTLKGKATVIIVPNTDDERTAAGSKTVNFTITALNLKNYKDVLADLFHIGEE
ncbi:MAG: hypothetical protein HDR03_06870 [Lachnospiraceae bacterium]|nr:hypothetical protein [Lachnospiraceae bacterium]